MRRRKLLAVKFLFDRPWRPLTKETGTLSVAGSNPHYFHFTCQRVGFGGGCYEWETNCVRYVEFTGMFGLSLYLSNSVYGGS